jgi:hypothetical protein
MKIDEIGCMCESFNPGMTVRPLTSMAVVAGPRSLSISPLEPDAEIFPLLTAIAPTWEGIPFVAIFALCKKGPWTRQPAYKWGGKWRRRTSQSALVFSPLSVNEVLFMLIAPSERQVHS